MRRIPAFILALCLTACIDSGSAPAGLALAADTGGPVITWDLDAEPLPEIPFPNDVATRLDPDSPTGRRVNVSVDAATDFERDLREKADQLSGFGIYSPITVGFAWTLDLCNLAARHHNDTDFGDDAIYIVNLTEGEHFGELAELDMGRGYFPNVLERRAYFEGDPGTGQNLMLKDTPLPDDCPAGVSFEYDKNTFYEHETNTLILQVMQPLREVSTYGVVLTSRLTDLDGRAVRSPFPWVNHVRQTKALSRLEEALAQNGTGVTLDEVAFAWTFTTQDVTRSTHDLRRGLFGHGPFAFLGEKYPAGADDLRLHDLFDDEPALPGNPYVLPWPRLANTLKPFIEDLLGSAEGVADDLLITYEYVDYVFSGTVRGPNFLADRDGIATPDTGCDAEPGSDEFDCKVGIAGDDDEIIEIDYKRGTVFEAEQEVSFWCVVPKKDRRVRAGPFPVALYGHGYTSGRFELLGFAGNHARHGIATCAIDAFGHGVVIDPRDIPPNLVRAAFRSGGIGGAVDALIPGRARDVNNDGVPDSGGDFWTADAFHTRDIVRQSVLDHSLLLKLFKNFDGRDGPDMNGDGVPEKLGDFDGDGEIDLGGPDAAYYAWGQSMGGILSGIMAGMEPILDAAAPTAGAAGLFDVGVRSRQGGVAEAVWLPLMGPIFYGRAEGETTTVWMLVSDFNKKGKVVVGRVTGLAAGDEVHLANLRNGKSSTKTIAPDGEFRLSVSADALSASEKRALLGFSVLHPEHPAFGTEPPPAVSDTVALGDPLVLTVCSGACVLGDDGRPTNARWTLDTFEGDTDEGLTAAGDRVQGVYFQGTVYTKGSPLIALADGFGYERQTPNLRRIRGIAGFIVEAGDPVAYTRFYSRDRDEWRARWKGAEPGEPFGTYVNVIATLGDMNVPMNTGVMMAWTAGFMEPEELIVLRDNYVLEAVEDARADFWGAAVLYDPDNLSEGTDGFQVDGVPSPRPAPGRHLRVRYVDPDGAGVHGLRLPAILPRGDHGFLVPNSALPFDVHSFMAHQISRYFITGGADLRDDLCMHDQSCAWMPQ